MKVLITLSFDGTAYHGFQVQKNARSVCETLQDALAALYGVRPPVSDSVRIRRMERQLPDSLPPVAEEPREEDPAVKK